MHPLEDEHDEIDTPSAEDLYIDLEHEMSKISPYTCPTRVRILLQKIAFKVHKEKDPARCVFRAIWYWEVRAEVEDDSPAAPITNKFGHPEVNKQLAGSAAGKFKDDEVHHILPNYFYAKECFHTQITVDRSILLQNFSENLELLRSLLKLIEECSDPGVLGNLLAIFRELLAARTDWRPAAMHNVIEIEATEVFAKLLVKVTKTNQTAGTLNLSDHSFICAFWILSALATKDSKFSLKLRQCGATKSVFPILKHLSGKVGSLYPILQVVKALSRNTVTSMCLGKDGIVTLITNITTKLARSQYGPRLKVAVEALSNLTRNRQNQLVLTKQNSVQELVGVFNNYEKYLDRNARTVIKITGALLYVFQHIVSSKVGKQQFLDAGGLDKLKEFCTKSIFDDKRWDRLLYRACTVLCKVCDAKPLPVECEMSPAKFNIPEDHKIHPEVESSSESTSRETTPESDDSDEEQDQDNEDEEEEVAEQDDEDKNEAEPDFPVSAKPILQRDQEDLIKSYAKFFTEYSTSTNNHLENHTITNSKAAKVTSDDNIMEENYSTFALQTHGLIKFVKIAYPDLVISRSPEDLVEPLLEKNKQACRAKVVKNIMSISNEIESDGNVVYDLDELIAEDKLFSRSSRDNSNLNNSDEDYVHNYHDFQENDQSGDGAGGTLNFESRFECGNLRKAIHVGGRQYDLILSPDINSDKHHQWFYFQVSNMKGGQHYPYIFNIINYEKANSQFNFGMQPVLFSVKEALQGRPHWRRTGEDICYFRNGFSKSSQINGDNYMTASFTITFPHDGDICYLAYHYPYTYSRLKTNLEKLATKNSRKDNNIYLKIDQLTESLGNHDVPLVTITSKPKPGNLIDHSIRPLSNPNIPICDKPIVVLTGRVHPGETNSSWIMEGILDFLTGDAPDAEEIRNHYVFKIIPMLNVEGVINGCHRCGLTGEDLNRRWQDPHETLHPAIYHCKGLFSYIRQVLQKEVFVFCDFHGHSRKKNVFLYGCSSLQSWWPPDHEFYDEPHIYKQLSEILHKIEPTFDKRSCRYTIERGRESTARVVIWREFDVSRSYTIESTFSGCNLGKLTGTHINTHHLYNMGGSFVQGLMSLEQSPTYEPHDNYSEYKTSVEKDQGMKITRLVISMPQA